MDKNEKIRLIMQKVGEIRELDYQCGKRDIFFTPEDEEEFNDLSNQSMFKAQSLYDLLEDLL